MRNPRHQAFALVFHSACGGHRIPKDRGLQIRRGLGGSHIHAVHADDPMAPAFRLRCQMHCFACIQAFYAGKEFFAVAEPAGEPVGYAGAARDAGLRAGFLADIPAGITAAVFIVLCLLRKRCR